MSDLFQSPYLPKHLIPQPFFPSFLVHLLFTSTVIHCSKATAANIFAFKCFWQKPRVATLTLLEFQLGEIEASPLSWAKQPDQNKQPQFFPNRPCSASSANGMWTGNVGCCLLGSPPPLSWGVEDGNRASYNTTKLTVPPEIQLFFMD